MDIFEEFGYTFIWKKTKFVFQLYFLLVILFLILNDCWNLIIDIYNFWKIEQIKISDFWASKIISTLYLNECLCRFAIK